MLTPPKDIAQNWVSCLVNYFHTSLTYSFNYARSGATIDNSIIANPSGVQSVNSQVRDSFVPLAGSHPNQPSEHWDSSNAIAGFFIGINEYVVLILCLFRSILTYSQCHDLSLE